jgi:hypothetical protein
MTVRDRSLKGSDRTCTGAVRYPLTAAASNSIVGTGTAPGLEFEAERLAQRPRNAC